MILTFKNTFLKIMNIKQYVIGENCGTFTGIILYKFIMFDYRNIYLA